MAKVVHYILCGIGNYDNFTSEPMSLSKAKKELGNHIRELKNNHLDLFNQAKRYNDIYQDDMSFKIGNEEFFQAYDIRLANEESGVAKDLRDIIDLCFSADREAEKYQWTLEDMDGLYRCTYVICEKAKKILAEITSNE